VVTAGSNLFAPSGWSAASRAIEVPRELAGEQDIREDPA